MTITRHDLTARYAQAVVNDGVAYIAGQIADTYEGDMQTQAREVLAKVDRHLRAVGSSRKQLLSMNVWVSHFEGYAAFNAVYDEWIDGDDKPARATVRAELLDPRLLVEVSALAAVPPTAGSAGRATTEAAARVEYLETDEALKRIDDEALLFVDVRERHEREGGHIPGSLGAPRGSLEFALDPTSELHLEPLASGRRLVMVCGSGGRAVLATRLATELGLDVVCLRGGMRAWREAGGPVVTSG